jgi:hypothetical protein
MIVVGHWARGDFLESVEAKEVFIPPPKAPNVGRLVVVEGFPNECHNPPIIDTRALARVPPLEAVEDKKRVTPFNYGKVGLPGSVR